MRRPILLAVVLFVIWASIANASLDYALAQKYVDKYNGKVDAAPSAVKDLLGNERVGLDVALENGSAFKAGFEMSNARIVKMYPGGIPNPTIDISTTESAINSMAGSKDKIAAFQDAMNNGPGGDHKREPLHEDQAWANAVEHGSAQVLQCTPVSLFKLNSRCQSLSVSVRRV